MRIFQEGELEFVQVQFTFTRKALCQLEAVLVDAEANLDADVQNFLSVVRNLMDRMKVSEETSWLDE